MNEETEKPIEYYKTDYLREEIQKTENFNKVADIFSLLSDSNRLKIFWLLCHSKESVNNLSKMLNMTNPLVSHHLKLLKDSGIVESYRDGKEVFYTASSSKEQEALHEIIEKLMSINCPDFNKDHEKINNNSEFQHDQVEKIKQVHDYLTKNLSRRITIEELSKKFAMNTTTLKTIFKDVYGTSIAAHINNHRMEKAAKLLKESDLSINEIAKEVGYESQSKFSTVFKEAYGISPMEYKKDNGFNRISVDRIHIIRN